MAGRKLTFDREVALEKAMDLFWEKGYNATGLTELLQQMGIQRQSLYNTFGNKRDLFLAAIAQYGEKALARLETQLSRPGSPRSNLEDIFYQTAENAKILGYRGCFITNTMIELAPHDPQIAAEVERLAQAAEKLIEQTLDQAIAAKELPPQFHSPSIARYLYHILLGLNTRIKSIPNPEHLHQTIDIALTILYPEKKSLHHHRRETNP